MVYNETSTGGIAGDGTGSVSVRYNLTVTGGVAGDGHTEVEIKSIANSYYMSYIRVGLMKNSRWSLQRVLNPYLKPIFPDDSSGLLSGFEGTLVDLTQLKRNGLWANGSATIFKQAIPPISIDGPVIDGEADVSDIMMPICACSIAEMRAANQLWIGTNFTGPNALNDGDEVGSFEDVNSSVTGTVGVGNTAGILLDLGNGQWGIYFTHGLGGTGYLLDTVNPTGDVTISFIASQTDFGTYSSRIINSIIGGPNSLMTLARSDGNTIIVNAQQVVAGPLAIDNDPHILTMSKASGGDWSVWFDGNSESLAGTINDDFGEICLATAGIGSAEGFTGVLAAFAVYNRNLTDDQRAFVEDWEIEQYTTTPAGSAVQFVAASNQLISASDASFNITGGFWCASWIKWSSGTFAIMFGKEGNTGRDYDMFVVNGDACFSVWDDMDVRFNAIAPDAVPPNEWHFVLGWYDPDAQTINIQVDNDTIYSEPFTGAPHVSAQEFSIGGLTDDSLYCNSISDTTIFGKPVTIGDVISDISSVLYNSGNGFAATSLATDINGDQLDTNAWGVVSGWDFERTLSDVTGTNLLVGQNDPNFTTGKLKV